MRRLSLLFALLLALPLSAAVAAPAGWLSTHYYEFSELSLGTQSPEFAQYPDCGWRGAEYVLNTAPDFTPFNCGQPNFVWAPNCKTGPQTVVFKKRIWLPGEPATLKASLVSLNDRPLASMEIAVNDTLVLRAEDSVHKQGLKAKTGAFKLGWNVVEVSARKGETEPCASGGIDIGVYGHVYATFEADLVVSAAKVPLARNGSVDGSMTVLNQGPSVMTAGSVSFGAYTLELKQVSEPNQAILLLGPAIDAESCGYSYEYTRFNDKDYSGYRTSCLLKELGPGESATIRIVYRLKVPKGDFYYEWPVVWRADSREVTDPRQGNNGGAKLQGACRPARPPKCVNASGSTATRSLKE